MVTKATKAEANAREFNVAVAGVGGQGILTLAEILTEAAFKQGYDVRMSELHGLAQRGGSVTSQVRFGTKVYSSLIKAGHADVVFALEPLEGLRAAKLGAAGRTHFIINTHEIVPVSVTDLGDKYPTLADVKAKLKAFSKQVIDADATGIAERETGSAVMSNIYMLGIASARGLLPIRRELLLEAIKENVPEKYFELNRKIFELAK
ncbi:MAG: indolepyruvate oxidoreductase subunit beta [Candidatus Aenigmarchaeota archaeon]|nr:indolepyruvate oxidoreductase subunit beta [Candidatus Aenigmarchaeota archaeon]